MRVAVLGLDSAAPALVFERFRGDLPNLARLMKGGVWGLLESSHPPITVPAWACMLSGCDAGQLGIYGFRNRRNYDYGAYAIADARAVRRERIWDVLSRVGLRSIVLGVPPTYPVQPLEGCLVSCFLTPTREKGFTYPSELKAEVEKASGGYVFDVEDFRTNDKAGLLERIREKTRKHFAVARHLVRTRPWDLFLLVEMGVDRIHHGFWSYMDPAHPKYVPGNPFEDTIRNYYIFLDKELGQLLDLFPSDCEVWVVSDHGAKALEGGLCLNEWLIQQGYLVLENYPAQPTPIDRISIDWEHTRAWGDGGYYGRVFLNVRGREPQGILNRAEVVPLLEELRAGLASLVPGTRAYRPSELFSSVQGYPPDLIVYFGDLRWRSVGSVGLGAVRTYENDTGPDEANHDWYGMFIAPSPAGQASGKGEMLRIYDVGPSLLARFGLSLPPGVVGRPVGLRAVEPAACP